MIAEGLMSFADLAALGSFVSGIGVLVSLIYLRLQIRQNTRAVRSQIHQRIADSWLSLGAILSDHSREFTAALKADEKALADMPDDENYAFLSCIFVFFKHFENMYLQYQEGLIARELGCVDVPDVHVLATCLRFKTGGNRGA
jgi:hypothetical protein